MNRLHVSGFSNLEISVLNGQHLITPIPVQPKFEMYFKISITYFSYYVNNVYIISNSKIRYATISLLIQVADNMSTEAVSQHLIIPRVYSIIFQKLASFLSSGDWLSLYKQILLLVLF
jgi:hypothetical protein